MYIGKGITKLASVTEINGEYYMNLEFIGRWKIGDLIKTVKDGKIIRLTIDTKELDVNLKSLSDDHLIIRAIIDEENECDRYGLIHTKWLPKQMFVKASVKLLKPCHIKKTFTKYRWFKENGFIGPDDRLVLENERQYGSYRSIAKFLEYNEKYIKASKYEDRTISYKFSKYGVSGEIKKRMDGRGEMTLYAPNNQVVTIKYLAGIDVDKIYEIKINHNSNKYY